MSHPIRPTSILIAVCLVLFVIVAGVKVFLLNYRPDQIIPLEGWQVSVGIEAEGSGQDLSVSHFLPSSEAGQRVEQERFGGSYARYATERQQANRVATYTFKRPYGPQRATVTFLVVPQKVSYQLPDSLPVQTDIDDQLSRYLEAEPLIQKDDPEISQKARELGLYSSANAVTVVNKVFNYCHQGIAPERISGETDAVLACRLGEASCNGKSRLMVALCRHVGIPARLVGGLILQGRNKKATHQWVEVLLAGTWVPYCPLNGHAASKPASYVAFYRGDHGFFKHTSGIRFNYSFALNTVLVPRDRPFAAHRFLDITSVWKLLEKSGIPLAALGMLLVVPIGALVTIIFRNVVGVQTYGTFLPALIAYAFQGTGLWWGALIFLSVIAGGALVDALVSKLRLLHTPRLTVLMLFVVATLLSYGVWGLTHGNATIAQSLFFPLAINTITIERFFVIAQERGVARSFTILGWTMVAVAFCYMVMSSLALQMLVVFYPETFLLLLAAAVYLGRWTGLRVSELYRFRSLIFATSPRAAEAGNAH